jgi:TRAP-type C4-dicarboxylate transport system substrate-binding protein
MSGARRGRAAVAAWSAAVLVVSVAGAGVIKLATLVPEGSVWDKELRRAGAEWQEQTAGRVTLRVYPGGVAGDEPDVLRKMRIGQLDAATLTTGAIGDIEPSFFVFSIPLFFDSYEELHYVRDQLAPLLEERLSKQGFELLSWGQAGWLHVFSTREVRSVEDVKRLKIFVASGEETMSKWWKDNGFHPVPLAVTDILTGLQTGMIDVYPATPLAALTLQWFRQTPYMHALGLAPLMGATIVTRRSWQQLSAADQESLLASGRAMAARLDEEIPRQDRAAIEEMKKRGLTVVTDFERRDWEEAARTLADTMARLRVPTDVYEKAREAREAFRERQGSAASGGAR